MELCNVFLISRFYWVEDEMNCRVHHLWPPIRCSPPVPASVIHVSETFASIQPGIPSLRQKWQRLEAQAKWPASKARTTWLHFALTWLRALLVLWHVRDRSSVSLRGDRPMADTLAREWFLIIPYSIKLFLSSLLFFSLISKPALSLEAFLVLDEYIILEVQKLCNLFNSFFLADILLGIIVFWRNMSKQILVIEPHIWHTKTSKCNV